MELNIQSFNSVPSFSSLPPLIAEYEKHLEELNRQGTYYQVRSHNHLASVRFYYEKKVSFNCKHGSITTSFSFPFNPVFPCSSFLAEASRRSWELCPDGNIISSYLCAQSHLRALQTLPTCAIICRMFPPSSDLLLSNAFISFR